MCQVRHLQWEADIFQEDKLHNDVLEEIKSIFHEAMIFDIDFSDWSKSVVLIVGFGSKASSFTNKHCAFFELCFDQVSKFNMEFAHESEGAIYSFWTPYQCEIVTSGEEILFTIPKVSFDPSLQISCREITLEEINPSKFYKIADNWEDNGSTLLRPSVREMIE